MAERRHLLRLELAVCALVASVPLTLLVVGLDALRFHDDAWRFAVLAFEALALAVTGASLTRQLARQRAFARRLPTRPRTILGTPVLLVRSRRPLAFTLGALRPRIVVSDALIDLLDDRELASVLAHERHHARRRDPLRRACVRAIGDGFWFVPGLRGAVRAHAALSELAADAVAIRSVGARPLAGALIVFEDHGPAHAGASPERVRHVLGELGRPANALGLGAAAAVLLTLASAAVYPVDLCLALGAPLALLGAALACVPAGLAGRLVP
ncbi:M56 family metallopeptidase [Solirubrobacter sp. CPCC 204708]|uniref:M56 family metallopeptidase n=1 Tax=Solirubrobacter deserti TaxID=2282478 RepID=A0ABT4RQ49_9ACTN|nr:M56 family metallopeptidase [Solirubrobacter deserti]MBE2315701.1 M56 family metallopeptidase [Solirubrobacter deserti]MDA0140410.1 M56 family metallopeptidase [Solirubrobacter deserti]